MRRGNDSGMVCFYFLLALKRAGLVRAVSATLASFTRPVGHSITHCSVAQRRDSPRKKKRIRRSMCYSGRPGRLDRALKSYMTTSRGSVVHVCFPSLRSRRSDHRDFPPCICADTKTRPTELN